MNFSRKALVIALSAALAAPGLPAQAYERDAAHAPRTPIEHVIVVIGENHSFDNVFGAYQAPHGQRIDNLLAKGIINADGTPGKNFARAGQQQVRIPMSIASIRRSPDRMRRCRNRTQRMPPVSRRMCRTRAFRPICPTVRFRSRAMLHITHMSATPCIASSRCGSSTAMAAPISRLGLRLRPA